MKLKQKRGRQFDSLESEGDRIVHTWSLKNEKGERSTDLINLDPNFAQTERKTEGKLPYLVIGLIFLGLVLLGYPGDGVFGTVLRGLFAGACLASFLVAIFIRSKEIVTILQLNDGSVFAVIRHHWTSENEREEFLATLKSKIEG